MPKTQLPCFLSSIPDFDSACLFCDLDKGEDASEFLLCRRGVALAVECCHL